MTPFVRNPKEFGLDSATDDALLGSEALAALGLLVDCRNRRLVLPPSAEEERGMRSAPFLPGGPYAWLEVVRGNHSSNTTCLTQAFFKSGE